MPQSTFHSDRGRGSERCRRSSLVRSGRTLCPHIARHENRNDAGRALLTVRRGHGHRHAKPEGLPVNVKLVVPKACQDFTANVASIHFRIRCSLLAVWCAYLRPSGFASRVGRGLCCVDHDRYWRGSMVVRAYERITSGYGLTIPRLDQPSQPSPAQPRQSTRAPPARIVARTRIPGEKRCAA